MEYAEVYMLLLRKTTIAPVVGEAMGEGFWGQIDLDGWSWNLVNEKRQAKLKEYTSRRSEALKTREKERLYTELLDATAKGRIDQATKITEKLKKLDPDTKGDGKEKAKADSDEEGRGLSFKFQKRLDTSSTQILNMMKGGIPFEKAVVTIVHRAGIMSKVPGLLSMQFTNLLITKYDLSVEQDDTGTELKEEWEAEFTHVMFEYSRRMDPLAGSNALATGMGKTIFVMKPRLV